MYMRGHPLTFMFISIVGWLIIIGGSTVMASLCLRLLRVRLPLTTAAAPARRTFACSRRLLKDEDKAEDMDKLQKNPYFDKYAEKIAKLQK